jgi:hypothetical protein
MRFQDRESPENHVADFMLRIVRWPNRRAISRAIGVGRAKPPRAHPETGGRAVHPDQNHERQRRVNIRIAFVVSPSCKWQWRRICMAPMAQERTNPYTAIFAKVDPDSIGTHLPLPVGLISAMFLTYYWSAPNLALNEVHPRAVRARDL